MFREVIYQDSIKDLEPLSGEIEMDETMFGDKRPGKRGWGASGKNCLWHLSEKRESPYFSHLFQSQRDHDALD